MKRVYPDIGETLRGRYIGDLASVRKLKRYWGTTNVNGVEVLNLRQYYHQESDRSENFEKLFKFLGAYKDVTEADMKGVEKAWLYFNKNNSTDLPEIDAKYESFIADNLNRLWWDPADGTMPADLTLTTSVVIEANRSTTLSVPTTANLITPEMTLEERITAIQTNYETLWEACVINQEGVGIINKGSITDPVTKTETPDEDDLTPDDPWLAILARYALRPSANVPHTIKDVELGIGSNENGNLYSTYVVTVEIPYKSFNTVSNVVSLIANDLTLTYVFGTSSIFKYKLAMTNAYVTQTTIKKMDSLDLLTNPDLVSRSYVLWEDIAVHSNSNLDNLWVESGGKWYLKAAVFDNPNSFGLTHRKLLDYVLPMLESDYKKKSVSTLKKVLAVAAFVVAVVLAVNTGGQSLKGWALVFATAAAISVVSLVFVLLVAAASALGAESFASALAAANKFLEPLVTVAKIVYFVGSIYNAAAEEAAKAQLEEAGKEATKEAIKEAAANMAFEEVINFTLTSAAEFSVTEFLETKVTSFLDNLMAGAQDLISGTVSNASLEFTSKLVELSTMPAKNKIADLNARTADMQAEYEKLQEEINRENDVLQQLLNIDPKPATADWSIYAQVFDYPYEHGGGTLALGNIQRTTKQAIRKTSYDDPAFAGILVV